LNVIEQFWAVLRRNVRVDDQPNEGELIRRVIEAWGNIPDDQINKAIAGFAHRLDAVIALDGKCLNGHRDIIEEVKRGKSPEQIKAEIAAIQRANNDFKEKSAAFFARLRGVPVTMDLVRESEQIVMAMADVTKRWARLTSYSDFCLEEERRLHHQQQQEQQQEQQQRAIMSALRNGHYPPPMWQRPAPPPTPAPELQRWMAWPGPPPFVPRTVGIFQERI
jgi:hypothetical protein